MNRQEKIERLQSLQKALESCTRPIEGHSDPLSINDCWNWMRELLSELKDEDEKLLLRAEQFEREEEFQANGGHEHHQHVLTGVKRINGLIKRHLGLEDSSLRSNEPEKEPVFGRGYCAHCLKATKECSCYANPVSTTTETIQNPSPSLKALSEITDEHEN